MPCEFLSLGAGGKGETGFTEYDIHLATDTADPKTSPGVTIELRAEETQADDWPEEVQQALDEIGPDRSSHWKEFRHPSNVRCAWNPAERSYEPGGPSSMLRVSL